MDGKPIVRLRRKIERLKMASIGKMARKWSVLWQNISISEAYYSYVRELYIVQGLRLIFIVRIRPKLKSKEARCTFCVIILERKKT